MNDHPRRSDTRSTLQYKLTVSCVIYIRKSVLQDIAACRHCATGQPASFQQAFSRAGHHAAGSAKQLTESITRCRNLITINAKDIPAKNNAEKSIAQSLSALCSASGEHLTTVGSGHSLAEAVLNLSLTLFRLICSYHLRFPPFNDAGHPADPDRQGQTRDTEDDSSVITAKYNENRPKSAEPAAQKHTNVL